VRRLVVLGVITAVAGCGAGGNPSGHQAAAQKKGLLLSASFGELKSGSPVTWKLEVENAGPDETTLVFRSGKDGDVALLRDGREAYRWSGDKYFSQAMRQVRLEAGEHKTFTLEEKALSAEPGDYELVAQMDSDPAPPPARRSARVKSG
jgi:hypothetical protein